MDKRLLTKGYTLLEMMVVLVVISSLVVITNSNITFYDNKVSENSIVDEIVLKQFEVIMQDEQDSYDDNDIEVYFSHLGNTNKAQTVYINDEEYVISLATARIYKHE